MQGRDIHKYGYLSITPKTSFYFILFPLKLSEELYKKNRKLDISSAKLGFKHSLKLAQVVVSMIRKQNFPSMLCGFQRRFIWSDDIYKPIQTYKYTLTTRILCLGKRIQRVFQESRAEFTDKPKSSDCLCRDLYVPQVLSPVGKKTDSRCRIGRRVPVRDWRDLKSWNVGEKGRKQLLFSSPLIGWRRQILELNYQCPGQEETVGIKSQCPLGEQNNPKIIYPKHSYRLCSTFSGNVQRFQISLNVKEFHRSSGKCQRSQVSGLYSQPYRTLNSHSRTKVRTIDLVRLLHTLKPSMKKRHCLSYRIIVKSKWHAFEARTFLQRF